MKAVGRPQKWTKMCRSGRKSVGARYAVLGILSTHGSDKTHMIQIVHMPHYEKLLIKIVNMGHICENDMIQIKDMFQIVAIWLQFSTEEYMSLELVTRRKTIILNLMPNY